MIFIDCGGNHGQSIAEARRIFGNGGVFSFEPVPYLFRKMKKRFKHDPNVHLIEAAVSNIDGTSKLYLSNRHADGSSLLMTDADRLHDLSEERYINVRTVRLSKFLSDRNMRGVILKLDIEGAEYDVLDDLIETQEIRRVSAILIEWHIKNAITDDELSRVMAIKNRTMDVCKNLNIQISEWHPDTKYSLIRPNRFPLWLKMKWAVSSMVERSQMIRNLKLAMLWVKFLLIAIVIILIAIFGIIGILR